MAHWHAFRLGGMERSARRFELRPRSRLIISIAGLEGGSPIRLPLLILTGCLLSSCSTAMDLLDREPAKPDTYFRITAEGAGPLSGVTPFDQAAIKKLLPGYATETVLTSLETATSDAIGVFAPSAAGQTQILHIVGTAGGTIREIHGVGRHVLGPNGEQPGMTLAETHADPASCRAGQGLWKAIAVCRSPLADNVTLTFAYPAESATPGHLPPRSILMTAQLQQIIWQAKKAS